MEKYNVTFRGKEYPVREVDLSPILDGYGVECIGSYELSRALQEATQDYSVDDQEATEIDNGIYCYMGSGEIESDPTDAELLWKIVKYEGGELDDQHYYNLMRQCEHEINLAHERGGIAGNVECYEMGGEYTAYTYGQGYNINLYRGRSARECCLVMLTAVTMLARNCQWFTVALNDNDNG